MPTLRSNATKAESPSRGLLDLGGINEGSDDLPNGAVALDAATGASFGSKVPDML